MTASATSALATPTRPTPQPRVMPAARTIVTTSSPLHRAGGRKTAAKSRASWAHPAGSSTRKRPPSPGRRRDVTAGGAGQAGPEQPSPAPSSPRPGARGSKMRSAWSPATPGPSSVTSTITCPSSRRTVDGHLRPRVTQRVVEQRRQHALRRRPRPRPQRLPLARSDPHPPGLPCRGYMLDRAAGGHPHVAAARGGVGLRAGGGHGGASRIPVIRSALRRMTSSPSRCSAGGRGRRSSRSASAITLASGVRSS